MITEYEVKLTSVIDIDTYILCELIEPELKIVISLVCKKWRRLITDFYFEKKANSGYGRNLFRLKYDLQLEFKPVQKGFILYAAANNYLVLVKWAKENGAPWDERICSFASRYGHLEVLKCARENGAPWDERTCSSAAEGGHLEVLKWARENGAPWDEFTCAYAAGDGHLELLKWARENGAPWDERTCASASAGGHLTLLEWARENDAPWDFWPLKHNRCKNINRSNI